MKLFKNTFNLTYPFCSQGNIYTLRIMASQMITSDKFDTLSHENRNCSLPHETAGLKYLRTYSKSGCEYECLIEKGVQKCQCIPWNMPRDSLDKPPFCDLLGNMCFFHVMSSTRKTDCNCPTDCRKTTLNIFESSRSGY